MNVLKIISGLLGHQLPVQAGTVATPVSHQVTSCRWTSYVNKWMRRDVIRRDMVKEYNSDRIRLNAIRKNKLLPRDLQEQADLDISKLPRDAFPNRIHKRCVMTSRPRGLINKYRISRIQFRRLADYNKLSGVIRAVW